MAGKGVDKKRLKAVGYGETKLLNKCVNGVECNDDEHKINRRTEFKITEQPNL
jgi:outer membrane protein OmpA-like peptidoglycan-associated protein